MKKVIITLLLSLLAPGLAFAAYNDVQLSEGSSFVLSIGGSNLEFTVTGGNLQSANVDSGSVTLVLATGGSGINITSTAKTTFTYGAPATMTSEFTCNAGSSVLSFGGSGTVVVTPTGTTCTVSGGSSGSGGSSSDSTAPSSSPAPAQEPTPTLAPVVTPAPVVSAAQIMAPLVAQPSAVAQLVSPVFNKDLQIGSRSDDVRRLQQLLAQDKDIYPDGSATGYYGKLTTNAIRKFQLKYGVIKKATDAGNGKLGPKTRAKLKEIFGSSSVPAPVSAPAPAPTPAPAASSLQSQLQALLQQLQSLQAKVKKP